MDTHTAQPQPPIHTIIRMGAAYNEATCSRKGDDPVVFNLTAARNQGKLSTVAAAICEVIGLGDKKAIDAVAGRRVHRDKHKAKQRRPNRSGPATIEVGAALKHRDEAHTVVSVTDMRGNPRGEVHIERTKLHLPMGD